MGHIILKTNWLRCETSDRLLAKCKEINEEKNEESTNRDFRTLNLCSSYYLVRNEFFNFSEDCVRNLFTSTSLH